MFNRPLNTNLFHLRYALILTLTFHYHYNPNIAILYFLL